MGVQTALKMWIFKKLLKKTWSYIVGKNLMMRQVQLGKKVKHLLKN